MGSTEENELAGIPGTVMSPFWSEFLLEVAPRIAETRLVQHRRRKGPLIVPDYLRRPRVMAWPITPEVRLPLPSGSGVTGVSSSRKNE